jgi:hypothetical protein
MRTTRRYAKHTTNNNNMEQILINTYPAGVANKLGQDVMVQRLNNLNRFDDCLVVDLDEGDKYFVHPQSLPQRSAEEILNFIQEKHLHIVFNTDVDGNFNVIETYSFDDNIDEIIPTTSLRDAINYLMDMDADEL